jgi:hypothetical protein
MKLLSSWTGVLICALLAVAMLAVAAIEFSRRQTPFGLYSALGLAFVALLISRRIVRRK